ncbi:hypothetical protein [Mycoplasmopsis columboralis]|uniref:Uncharacterized protein n=1 Tax=Mycoplasmopsis columboralis TaxID=171282 RepID=A0A449B5R4_9BACT|nr:hypothetical protein [Mycoplasmopsis columboralis]VEU75909.1 Uncharacterised protein [Mycoplasmopsis columboralis]
MRKNNKLFKATAVTAGVTGAIGLVSIGIMLSLHNNYKTPYNQTYYFMELKNEAEKTQKRLESLSDEQKQSDLVSQLNKEIDYANQLLKNEDSSIALMLQQRNKLRTQTPKTLLMVSTDLETLKNLVNEYAALVKEVDFQNSVSSLRTNALRSLESSLNEKEKHLNTFFELIDPLIKQQNDFSFALETKIWTNHEAIVKDNSALLNAQEKTALLSAIEQIFHLLAQPTYSKDALVEYENLYDEIIEKLSAKQKEQNVNLQQFLENVTRVKKEIDLIDLDEVLKGKINNQIDNYKNIALNPEATLATTKTQELSYLNDLVNNELKVATQENDDTNKLANELENLLNTIGANTQNENLNHLITLQKDLIKPSSNEDKFSLLNKMVQANNLVSVLNAVGELTSNIQNQIKENLQAKNLTQESANNLNQALNDVLNAQYSDINQYLVELTKIYNNVYDNSLLSSVFKNALTKLSEQVLDSQQNGLNVNQAKLVQISTQISQLLTSANEAIKLNDALRVLTNELREINREELRNWVALANEIIVSDNSVEQAIKDRLSFLNSQSNQLTPQNSTAIRDELQYLIAQYRQELEKANIDADYKKTLLKHSNTNDKLLEAFGGEEGIKNSPFGTKLLAQSNELKKQAQLIALNPNLSAEEKASKLADIRRKLDNIANNAEKFKKLEEAVAKGDEAIESSKDNKSEQAYLQKEANKIRDTKEKALKTLENAGDAADVDALIDQMNDDERAYREKQAEFQSTHALAEDFKTINDEFAPYMIGGQPTPTQQKFLDKLTEYQNQLADSNLSDEQRNAINEKVKNLIAIVHISKELEVKNNNLKTLVQETQSENFGSFKPQAEYDKTTALNNEIDAFLENILDSNVTEEQIQANIDKVDKQYVDLSLKVSVALLQKTNADIQSNKFTDASLLNISPYTEINASLETLNQKTQELINKEDKTQAQVNELEGELRKYRALAVSLHAAGAKLATIDKDTYPQTYKNLLNSILSHPDNGNADEPTNSLINFGDSLSVIALKNRALTLELQKVENRQAVEDNIKTLEQVYTADHRNRAIFDDAIAIYDATVAEYKVKLGEFYSSRNVLGTLRDEIEVYTNREKAKRDDIQAQWDAAIARKANLVKEYNARKENANLASIPNTQKVFDDFDALVNKTNDAGKFVTLTSELIDFLKQVPLGYAKDLYNASYEETLTKINELKPYAEQLNNDISTNIVSALTQMIVKWKETVNAVDNPEQISFIRTARNKLSALNTLVAQQKAVFDYLISDEGKNQSNSNDQDNQLSIQEINDALRQYYPTRNNEADLLNVSSDEIIEDRNNLREVFVNNVSLSAARTAQINEIEEYKKQIQSKKDATSDAESQKLYQAILDKLDSLITQTRAVQAKSELSPIATELRSIQFREADLNQLALKVSEVKTFVNGENVTDDRTGQKTILENLKNAYESYYNDYLSLSSQDISEKERELEQLQDLYNKFKFVYQLVIDTKDLIPAQYVNGTGTQGTPEEKRTQFVSYIDALLQRLNDNYSEQIIISSVESTVPSITRLINLHNEKITKYNQIKEDNSYSDFQYNSLGEEKKHNYGFNDDLLPLGDFILESIPTNGTTSLQINNTLYPNLDSKFNQRVELYNTRKQALDTIYKTSDQEAEKGYKVKEIESLYSSGTQNIDPKYSDLATKADEFFHAKALAIASATKAVTIEDQINEVVEIDSLFGKYKQIAEWIATAQTKIAEVESSSDPIKGDTNVVASLNKLKEEIAKGKEYYYSQKDSLELDNNIFFLETYLARLELAFAVASAISTLDNFNTTEGEEEFLTDDAKAPLRKIINKPFTELAENPTLETKENYERLLQIYVNGSSIESYGTAFRNSKRLQSIIYKANQYLQSYKTQLASNPNYEPENIKTLYTQLETKISEGTTALNNMQNDENVKLAATSAISNSNTGVLDLILAAKRAQIQALLRKNSSLNKYLSGHYPRVEFSPKLSDYEQVALTDIRSLDLSTPQNLVESNAKIKAAEDKYDQQTLAIYKWEANKYNSYKDKFDRYYNFLNAQNTNGVSKELILKSSGITQGDLDEYAAVITPAAEDSLRTNAKTYVEKLSESDEQLKSWLESNTEDILRTLSSVASELEGFYDNLIGIKSVPVILIGVTQYDRLKNTLTDDSSSQNVRYAIKAIGKENDLNSKLEAFLGAASAMNQIPSRNLKNDNDESTLKFNTSTPENVKTARQEYFDKYKQTIVEMASAKMKLDSLIFGDSDADGNTLIKTLHNYVEGSDSYEGRANVNNVLKHLASSAQNAESLSAENDKFAVVKNEYEKVSTPTIRFENQMDHLSKETSGIFDIYSALTKGYDRALTLHNWLSVQNNAELFFEYLTRSTNYVLNYADISPKSTTSGEVFENLIENDSNITEEDITIQGTTYKAKKLNSYFNSDGTGTIGNLFDKFNILKGSESIFNTDNVEVFVYKSTAENSKYIRLRLTSDPSVKRGFVNLYIRYKKPASVTAQNSAFSTVDSFGIKFENVGISFKTLDNFIIHKENIRNSQSLMQPLFTAQEAGWNNLQAPVSLMGSFVKYSALDALVNDRYYFTESLNEDMDAEPSQNTTSSKNFRIKVKLSSAYKGYTQTGDKIFWKTLNPNVASDKSIQYQNDDRYFNGTVAPSNRNTYNYNTTWRYFYNAATDEGKTLLFLPLVIGVPVRSSNDEEAIMVISWQILTRFDKNRTSNSQNISLGDNDVLRHVYFFKRSTAGMTNASTNTAEKFYDYVMNRIRYRDLVGLTFNDLRNSGLWNADSNIVKDDANSGKGGVGYEDFYTAIGENGRFDINFKLH